MRPAGTTNTRGITGAVIPHHDPMHKQQLEDQSPDPGPEPDSKAGRTAMLLQTTITDAGLRPQRIEQTAAADLLAESARNRDGTENGTGTGIPPLMVLEVITQQQSTTTETETEAGAETETEAETDTETERHIETKTNNNKKEKETEMKTETLTRGVATLSQMTPTSQPKSRPFTK